MHLRGTTHKKIGATQTPPHHEHHEIKLNYATPQRHATLNIGFSTLRPKMQQKRKPRHATTPCHTVGGPGQSTPSCVHQCLQTWRYLRTGQRCRRDPCGCLTSHFMMDWNVVLWKSFFATRLRMTTQVGYKAQINTKLVNDPMNSWSSFTAQHLAWCPLQTFQREREREPPSHKCGPRTTDGIHKGWYVA